MPVSQAIYADLASWEGLLEIVMADGHLHYLEPRMTAAGVRSLALLACSMTLGACAPHAQNPPPQQLTLVSVYSGFSKELADRYNRSLPDARVSYTHVDGAVDVVRMIQDGT